MGGLLPKVVRTHGLQSSFKQQHKTAEVIMKKIIGILSVASLIFATGANAQINVAWRNTQAIFFNGSIGAGNQIAEDFYHILVWSPSPAPAIDEYVAEGTGIGENEVILFQGNAGILGGQFNYPAQVFDDTDVDGADINTGYLYSRIFQFSTVSDEDVYWESPASMNFGPTLTEYDPALIPPDSDQIIEHVAPNSATALVMDASSPNFYLVPEPSVMALLGFGGLVLAIRRRMTLA
jgi:hypothetical protein